MLELGRWAPSAGNFQPWRFEIVASDHVILHLRDEPSESVYHHPDGQVSWLTFGFLLESLRIAATRYRRTLRTNQLDSNGNCHRFDVRFDYDPATGPDPLLPRLKTRSVDRRPYRLVPLSAEQKLALEESLDAKFHLHWAEGFTERFRWARVNARATEIRSTIPETFPVHQRMFDWTSRRSSFGIPVEAVGVDPLTRALMKWALKSWTRTDFLNSYLGATIPLRLELDILPGVFCAAHFFVTAREDGEPPARQGILDLGMSLQRLWLTADKLGLVMHPSVATLSCAEYARRALAFSKRGGASDKARDLERAIRAAAGMPPTTPILFLARIGTPQSKSQTSRSMRLPLTELLVPAIE